MGKMPCKAVSCLSRELSYRSLQEDSVERIILPSKGIDSNPGIVRRDRKSGFSLGNSKWFSGVEHWGG